MKHGRRSAGAVAALLAVAILHGCAGGAGQDTAAVRIVSSESMPTHAAISPGVPHTHRPLQNDPDAFQFAIVSDRTGGHREGIFEHAVTRLNLLQPQFVINVGDMIEGYTQDRAILVEQWDEFDGFVNDLEMRFFYVPGNHDLSNPVMDEVWHERRGGHHYAFIYRDVLFLCLNSQEGEKRAGLGDEQIAWAKQVLEQHGDVRWTLVFMHQPLWVYEQDAAAKGEDAQTGFPEVEQALAGRKYSVFAGHFHNYTKYVRSNRDYYILATTGGGSGMGGIPQGEFDHLMWVTMTPDGPRVANLMLDGIHDGEVRTQEQTALAHTFSHMWNPPEIQWPPSDTDPATQPDGALTLPMSLTNPLSQPVTLRLTWQTTDTGWIVQPAADELTLPAGGEGMLHFAVRTDGHRPLLPSPRMTLHVQPQQGKSTELSMRWPVMMRPSAAAARLTAAPRADGVIEEGEYGSVVPAGEFGEYRGRHVAEQQTRFLAAYDDEALYIAVIADEPNPAGVAAHPRQRDGEVWRDDSIEVFIDANFDRTTYHQLASNMRGDQLDAIGGPGHGTWGNATWNGKWLAAAKVHEDRCVVEFAIPFESLGVHAPQPGETWGLNVCRSRQQSGEQSGWAITYRHFHVPGSFGNLRFE